MKRTMSLFLFLFVFVLAFPVMGQQRKFLYPAKFVCGTSIELVDPLGPGVYKTLINVLNPTEQEITIRKKIVQEGKVGTFSDIRIGLNGVFDFACEDIFPDTVPVPAPSKNGFAVIKSDVELAVWAVYTTITPAVTTAPATGAAPGPQVVRIEPIIIGVNAAPASTKLMFNFNAVGSTLNTGIAIANVSDELGSPTTGGITFRLFPTGASPLTVTSTLLTSKQLGSGVNPDGTLSPGSTFAVLLSELLQAVEASESFTGYILADCDFPKAKGINFIADRGFSDFAQGYQALDITSAQ
ncbi:hypothetical protein MYX84_03850 [Acidobacteria bacterium AH-259-O06]|nr:hypothetical protein [Acidobacteria bacterium AH-259-O06]